MKLIAVSGSTKCDWRLVDGNEIMASFESNGLNPFFHSQEHLVNILEELKSIQDHKKNISEVYIYGAGCGSKSLQNIVRNAVYEVIPKSHVLVSHDIVASALATYDSVPSISCILGTGSNSCYFDGDIVRQEVPALDYVLGDEGGGSYYGKILLSTYLHHRLPEDLHNAFKIEYNLTKEDILERIYMQPYANVYLASFMTFIQSHKDHNFIHEMVSRGMKQFCELFILPYHQHKTVKAHFTGSIAFYFNDILKKVAEQLDIQVGVIIKEPIEGLVKYHIKK
ncbi:MAG: ATPase [Bacteroidota bacterium]